MNPAARPTCPDLAARRDAAAGCPLAAKARARGLTLVEAAVMLALLAILVGLAVPNFAAARERRHLDGAAALLETDLQLARASAVARGAVVRMDFGTRPDGASCYVLHTGGAGACGCGAQAPVCQPGAVALRHAGYAPGLPLRVAANVGSMAFEPVQGMVTPTGTVRVVGASGAAVHQIVNVMGRVRSCSPTLAGYARC